MVALNRYRWPLPTDPSGPPMNYPEPMPTFIPSMTPPTTAAPPAPMAQAPTAPTDTAYPPTDFQGPQTAAPKVSQEDEQFNRQMEEERVEADWTRMTKRETAVLKVEADMQKARNAVAKAHKEATQRPSLEAPDEPLNRVFDRYVKGHAPMPTLEEYKASVRAPTGAEALSWTGEAPGFQDYITAGGEPEELERIRKEEADRITLEKYAPQYRAPFQDLTFREGRELVRKQREHREATMAPIQAKLASIRERRKELKRLRKPPTWQDIFEQQQTVARIKAGEPAAEAPRYAKELKHKGDILKEKVLDNEILEVMEEIEALGPKPSFWTLGDRYSKKEWQAETNRLTTRLNKLNTERREIAGLERETKSTLPRPRTEKEYNNLPSGTPYMHPDGNRRTKP